VHTLNFITHGLYAIVEEPYRLVIAVPFVKDHQYQLGVEVTGKSNQDMKPYGPGTYEVGGIQGGAMVFDPDKVAKVKDMRVLTTAPPAHSVFVLPRPYDIHHCNFLTQGPDGDVELTGADAPAVKAIPLVTVLIYRFGDISTIRITGMPDFHAQFKPGSQEFVNVTLFAANLNGHEAGRAPDAFGEMMKLIPGKDIRLKVHKPGALGTGKCGVPGLDDPEPQKSDFGAPRRSRESRPDDCTAIIVDNTEYDQ
jgi:hypothetical protein